MSFIRNNFPYTAWTSKNHLPLTYIRSSLIPFPNSTTMTYPANIPSHSSSNPHPTGQYFTTPQHPPSITQHFLSSLSVIPLIPWLHILDRELVLVVSSVSTFYFHSSISRLKHSVPAIRHVIVLSLHTKLTNTHPNSRRRIHPHNTSLPSSPSISFHFILFNPPTPRPLHSLHTNPATTRHNRRFYLQRNRSHVRYGRSGYRR